MRYWYSTIHNLYIIQPQFFSVNYDFFLSISFFFKHQNSSINYWEYLIDVNIKMNKTERILAGHQLDVMLVGCEFERQPCNSRLGL